MNRFLARRRGKDPVARLTERLKTDSAWPELSARFEQLRRELDFPTFSRLAGRFHTDGDWPSLSKLLERVQTDHSWPRMRRLLDRAQQDIEIPRFAELVEKWHHDLELPDVSMSMSGQQRQALRGLLLLGMALHTAPIPIKQVTPSLVGGRTSIAETDGGTELSALQRLSEVQFFDSSTAPAATSTALDDVQTHAASTQVVACAPAASTAPGPRQTTHAPHPGARVPPSLLASYAHGSRAPPASASIRHQTHA